MIENTSVFSKDGQKFDEKSKPKWNLDIGFIGVAMEAFRKRLTDWKSLLAEHEELPDNFRLPYVGVEGKVIRCTATERLKVYANNESEIGSDSPNNGDLVQVFLTLERYCWNSNHGFRLKLNRTVKLIDHSKVSHLVNRDTTENVAMVSSPYKKKKFVF